MKLFYEALIVLLCLCYCPVSSSQVVSPKVVGHRGFNHIAPENTIPSMNLAAIFGAGGSECDVSLSADGTVIVLHDNTTNRTTSNSMNLTVATSNSEQLAKVCVGKLQTGEYFKGIDYSKTPLPTLDQLLAAQNASVIEPAIEIKSTTTTVVTEAGKAAIKSLTDKTIQSMETYGYKNTGFIISFDVNALAIASEQGVATAWVTSSISGSTDAAKVATVVNTLNSCGSKILDASSSCYTQSLVTALKAATLSDGSKITLWSWTVDSKDTATNFYNWGIDSITSNRVDYALQALNASSASKTTTWTGNAQDSNFANPENFSDNLTPSENKVIFSNGTAQLTNSLTMASLTMGNGSTLDINNGGRGAAAVLTMDTGSNLNINQGAVLSLVDSTTINGTMKVSGGSFNYFSSSSDTGHGYSNLHIGNGAGTSGSIEFSGDSVSTLSGFYAGYSATSTSTAGSGVITVKDNAVLNLINNNENSSGFPTASILGNYGSGTFNQTGGTVNSAGQFWLGEKEGSSAEMNLSGGVFNQSARMFVGSRCDSTLNISDTAEFNSTAQFIINYGSLAGITCTVNQTGGTANIQGGNHTYNSGTVKTSSSGIQFGTNNIGGKGIYNQSGGTLNTPRMFRDSGSTNTGAFFELSGNAIANITSLEVDTYMHGGTLNAQTILTASTGSGSSYVTDGTFKQYGGTMSPGLSAISTTAITGNYTISGESTLEFDMRTVANSDKITVSGAMDFGSDLATIMINTQYFDEITSGTYTFIAANSYTGTASYSGELLTMTDSQFQALYGSTATRNNNLSTNGTLTLSNITVQTSNWTGNTSTDFTNSENWSAGYIPSSVKFDNNENNNQAVLTKEWERRCVSIADAAGTTAQLTVSGEGNMILTGELTTTNNSYYGLVVGKAGAGTLSVSQGGSVSVDTAIRLGNANGATGIINIGSETGNAYWKSTGSIVANGTYEGIAIRGAGDHAYGDFIVGSSTGGTGTVNFNKCSNAQTVGFIVGLNTGSTGEINIQNGAYVHVNNKSTGVYPNTTILGYKGSAVFNQSGGEFISDGQIFTGEQAGSSAEINLSGGTFTQNARMFIASNGNATMTISGDAQVNISGQFIVGFGSAATTGTVNQTGGIVNILGGNHTKNSGDVSEESTGIQFGRSTAATAIGRYNQSGGELYTTKIWKKSGTKVDALYTLSNGVAHINSLEVDTIMTGGVLDAQNITAPTTKTSTSGEVTAGTFKMSGGTLAPGSLNAVGITSITGSVVLGNVSGNQTSSFLQSEKNTITSYFLTKMENLETDDPQIWINVQDADSYSHIDYSSTFQINDNVSLYINFMDFSALNVGDTFNIFRGADITGTFETISYSFPDKIVIDSTNLYDSGNITITDILPLNSVPEPSTYILILLGLTGIWYLRSKNSTQV